MSYDIAKLTNLGQMKSALQRMLQEIDAVKSTRTVVAVEAANWTSYSSGVYRYPSIQHTSNHNYYDVHLTADTSNAISTMCANAEIKAKIDANEIYLYSYGTTPDQDFNVEIIITPISENTQGLNYDIGDDYLVYPSITDALDTRLGELETETPRMTLFAQNITLNSNRWEASGNVDFPYKAVISMQHVTADYFPVVQFEDSDTLLYDFSNIATTGDGTVTIFCKQSPGTAVILPSIICYKGTAVTAS